MAITREEIEQIAKAVAERVVEGTPCSCGLATWNSQIFLEVIRGAINTKDKPMAKTHIPTLKRNSELIERFCGIDIGKAKEELETLSSEIEKENWIDAWGIQHRIFDKIGRQLEVCKEKELAETESRG